MLRTDIHNLIAKNVPDFCNEKLEQFDFKKVRNLPTKLTPAEQGVVDLSKVRGTNHVDYYDNTWLELLPTNPDTFEHIDYWSRHDHAGLMKRGWECIYDLRSNPNYYLDSIPKENWSFAKIGDEYYVTQGNHRTVVARFFLAANGLPQIIKGVSITEYELPKNIPSKNYLTLINKVKRWLSNQLFR